jgi:rRNA maturation RNase YbeY
MASPELIPYALYIHTMSLLELHNLSIIRKNGALPDLPFLAIKEKIIGKSYTLSVVFCTPEESRSRNMTYRNKDYPTNILSFPLTETEGEIYISLSTARRDAKNFDMTYPEFLHLLFVHGCLHLKGHDHGSTMEELEQKYCKQFFRGK